MRKDLCIFVNFSKTKIDNYVKVFVDELCRHFEKLLFVTNLEINTEASIYNNPKIRVLCFKNEGYDFGMFYKSLFFINPGDYDRIVFINDSNMLFNKLDAVFSWGNKCKADFWGITDSGQGSPGSFTESTYHIQSHFLVFERKAIGYLHAFFSQIGFQNIFDTKMDSNDLRLKIIADCEIGITQFLLSHNLTADAFFRYKDFEPAKSHPDPSLINMHIIFWKELIQQGYPFIKKKIVLNDFDPKYVPIECLPDFSDWEETVRFNMFKEMDFNQIFSK